MLRKPRSLLGKRSSEENGRFVGWMYVRWSATKRCSEKTIVLFHYKYDKITPSIPCYECDSEEEDAEEQNAWQERRGVWEVLEIKPELSKEDTVQLLTEQYDQALKQASSAVTFLSPLGCRDGVRRALSAFAFPPDYSRPGFPNSRPENTQHNIDDGCPARRTFP